MTVHQKKLQSRSGAVKLKADLIEEILRIWPVITLAYIQSLYGSIPKRIQQVPRSKYNGKCMTVHQKKLQSRSGAVKSKADLIEKIRRIWPVITPAYIQSLYGSIPKRFQQVIWLKGHLTKN